MGSSVLSPSDWSRIGELLKLSKRQLAIVKLVFDDQCDSEIAQTMGISRHTVNSHFGRLYQKLGVHSRVQLSILVFSQHLKACDLS